MEGIGVVGLKSRRNCGGKWVLDEDRKGQFETCVCFVGADIESVSSYSLGFYLFLSCFSNRKWWIGSSVCEICVVKDFLVGEKGTGWLDKEQVKFWYLRKEGKKVSFATMFLDSLPFHPHLLNTAHYQFSQCAVFLFLVLFTYCSICQYYLFHFPTRRLTHVFIYLFIVSLHNSHFRATVSTISCVEEVDLYCRNNDKPLWNHILKQWFSNFILHDCDSEGFLKHRLLGPTPQFHMR